MPSSGIPRKSSRMRAGTFRITLEIGIRAAGLSGCSYSYRYRSVIGTGVICEVQEPEEKKRALSAIMAHYEKSRPFAFTDEQTQRVAVFRLDVAQLTCKEHL